MKVKTRDLTGIALDWAVAKCLGQDEETLDPSTFANTAWPTGIYQYSSRWSHGGPIIERIAGFELKCWPGFPSDSKYKAHIYNRDGDWIAFGSTPLTAVMRCFVASHVGDEIEVPDELLKD